MKLVCQECNENPATIHFTKIINGEKTEFQLCENCSKKKGDMVLFNNVNGPFSIHNLLAGLMNLDNNFEQKQKSSIQETEELHCQKCKMTYSQFTNLGRFGCSECYKVFDKQLMPILRRLHSGNSSHTGKIPQRIGGSINLQRQIDDLKKALQVSIQQEEFERAAELRDEIRTLEKAMSSSINGGEHS